MEKIESSKYPVTNKLIVAFLLFSILLMLNSIQFVVVALIMDVFVVLGILSYRNKAGVYFDLLAIPVLGIVMVASIIIELLTDFRQVSWNSILMAIYLTFVGIVFIVNRRECNRIVV